MTLSTGERLAASTVVWCAGMRANPLTADLGVECDGLGRVAVDEQLRVINVQGRSPPGMLRPRGWTMGAFR